MQETGITPPYETPPVGFLGNKAILGIVGESKLKLWQCFVQTIVYKSLSREGLAMEPGFPLPQPPLCWTYRHMPPRNWPTTALWVEARGRLWVSSSVTLPLILKPTNSAAVAGQQDPRILPPAPQHWDYKHVPYLHSWLLCGC